MKEVDTTLVDVLLVNTPLEKKQPIPQLPSVCLALGYLASSLEQAGFKVGVIDNVPRGYDLKELSERIVNLKPQVVGFYSSSQTRFQVHRLARYIKEAIDPLVVLGGPHFSFTAEDTLMSWKEIDVVVHGEGELILRELVTNYLDNRGFSDVSGISFRNSDGQVIRNSDTKIVKDIDILPDPAYHLFNLNSYPLTLLGSDVKATGIISSRGCPYYCIFCSSSALRKAGVRFRDPKRVVDEISYLKERYGFKAFSFWDDTITCSRKHIVSLCKELINRNLGIKWFAFARGNTVDKEVLLLMREAGLYALAFGVESGSEKVQKTIQKGETVEEVKRAICLSLSLGILTEAYFIVSLPDETIEDLRMTAELYSKFQSVPGLIVSYSLATIYPGTALEKIAKDYRVLDKYFSWCCPFYQEELLKYGQDPTVPCYVNHNMSLDVIKYVMMEKQGIKFKVIRLYQKVKCIEDLKDFVRFLKLLVDYLNLKVKWLLRRI